MTTEILQQEIVKEELNKIGKKWGAQDFETFEDNYEVGGTLEEINPDDIKKIVKTVVAHTFSRAYEMRCKNYKEFSMTRPTNCYNCGLRIGYPSLFGSKECKNFKEVKK